MLRFTLILLSLSIFIFADTEFAEPEPSIINPRQIIFCITEGDDDIRIDLAIIKTREFFESLGIKTRLSEYGVKADEIDNIVDALKKRGFAALSESGDLTLEISREILEHSQ